MKFIYFFKPKWLKMASNGELSKEITSLLQTNLLLSAFPHRKNTFENAF